MVQVYILFSKDKSIQNSHKGIMVFSDTLSNLDLNSSKGDHDVIGHPQQPRHAQLRGVQQVPVMFIKI